MKIERHVANSILKIVFHFNPHDVMERKSSLLYLYVCARRFIYALPDKNHFLFLNWLCSLQTRTFINNLKVCNLNVDSTFLHHLHLSCQARKSTYEI